MSLEFLKDIQTELQRKKERAFIKFDATPFSFPAQLRFIKDQSQFVDALTTRRAGKSNGIALKQFEVGYKYKNVLLPYLALTRQSAKDIMWPALLEQSERCGVPINATESNLTVTLLDSGSKIRLYGADQKNFVRRMRGIKSPLISIDEAGEFGSHLEYLVDDVLTPCIADFPDGQIVLTGTPGPVPFGYFFQVSDQKQFGFSHHTWSLFDNPFMPNPKEFVRRLKEKKKWKDDNPTFLREWNGKWVKDLDVLVIKYDPTVNDYLTLPRITSTVMAVDLGFKDADAIAILGWDEANSSDLYLVEEDITRKQGVTDLAAKMGKLIKTHNPMAIVMDTGGLGLKIAEEIQKRYSIPIKAAEKSRKFEYIELLNDALITGQFHAKAKSVFAQDSMKLQWDADKQRPDKKVISEKFHSDIIDAGLYAYREALHWLHVPKVPIPEKGTKEYDTYVEDQIYNDILEQQQMKKDDLWGDNWGEYE